MLFLAQAQSDLHDIAPPVDYSLIPTWVIFLGSVLALLLLGLIIWQVQKALARRRPAPVPPRERALAALRLAEADAPSAQPYEFSIRVSNIVRQYVVEQFELPMTRQTSLEFLNAIRGRASFTDEERTLLADFLERCDLIKFARFEASSADNARLLEESRRFVEGGKLVAA